MLFDLLKTKRFLPLFITQFLGAFNDNVFKNALVILITFGLLRDMGLSPALTVTLASAIFILPFFLFSATAGQLADKFEKSRLITIIKSFEIVIMLCATLGFYYQDVHMLLGILFLLGTHSSFFGPLKYAILPDHLKTEELIAGNGLIEAGTFIAILLGTIIGGIFILHSHGTALISAILLLAAVFGWLASFKIPKAHIDNSHLIINKNIFYATLQLLKYTKRQDDIFLAVLGISWFWLLGSIFLTQMPTFVKNTLHADDYVFTFFISLFSIGIAIGSLLCNRLLKGKVHATYVPLGALGMTIFTIDLYFSTQYTPTPIAGHLLTLTAFCSHLESWRTILDLLLIAAFGGLYSVPLYAMVQYRSEPHYRARVIASNNVMNALFMVAAALLSMGILALGFRVDQLFLITALLNVVVALYLSKLSPDTFLRRFFR